MKKRIVILGSTGSIGRSALDLISRNRGKFEVVGLSAHANHKLLRQQIEQFSPKAVALTDEDSHEQFAQNHEETTVNLLPYSTGIRDLIHMENCDIVLNAIVGAAGLIASLETVKLGKRLALANKESMVIGGPLLNQMADEHNAEIIPVDSEHSAIWQCLSGGKKEEVKNIILTGSGGPFRERPIGEFNSITKEEALNHPTWNMGAKITIDSATMMNKGLEIIEAVYLFRVPIDKIKVVIHPQSVVHSMVEYIDSSIIAQLSHPDMKLPILYALSYPDRIASEDSKINLADQGQLTFFEPDYKKFRLLDMGIKVARTGGTATAVYNAANEIAVAAFLNDAIGFAMIPEIVMNTLDKHESNDNPVLEEIIEADRWARETAHKFSGVMNC